MKANLYYQIVSVLLIFILPCNIIHSQEFTMPSFVHAIDACDMDMDGSNDIIVSCANEDSIVILFNDGYGNFDPYYYGRNTQHVFCGCIDEDSLPDLITFTEGYIYFIKNNGNRTLGEGIVTIEMGATFPLNQIIDMNNDGWNDIVYARDTYWGIFINNGDLSFSNVILESDDGGPAQPSIGNFNNDSLPDIIISYSYSNRSQITKYLINNGNFNFTTSILNDFDYKPVVSNMDNNFLDDLTLFYNPTPEVHLFENIGDATFLLRGIHYTQNSAGVIFANCEDYNQDGYDDFSYSQCFWSGCTDSLYVELNDQNWSFLQAQQYFIGTLNWFRIKSADLNGDSYPDFYMTGYNGNNTVKILWNDGDGTFSYLNPVGVQDLTLNKNFTFKVNPNPFNTKTKINYSLDNESTIQIKVFNNLGQLVETITETGKSKGSHSYDFDASELNTGIYFCTLIVNGKSAASMKMVVL
jgi:hypothetical protein